MVERDKIPDELFRKRAALMLPETVVRLVITPLRAKDVSIITTVSSYAYKNPRTGEEVDINPRDCKSLAVYYDPAWAGFLYMLVHPKFEPIEEGKPVPYLKMKSKMMKVVDAPFKEVLSP